MINGLVKQYRNMSVSIPGWLESHDEQSKKDHIELKKRQWLVRSLLNLTRDENIQWSVSESSKLAFASLAPNSIIAIHEMTYPSSRWTGGVVYTHILTLFESGKEILVVKERHEEREYDELSASLGTLPIVDLYDLSTTGERRKGRLTHVCGSQGFGALGDVCPACEGSTSYPHMAVKLPY